MRYQIGQLTVGQIMDQSFQMLKNHWKLFLGITGTIYLPLIILQALVTYMVTPKVTPGATQQQVLAQMEGMWVLMPVLAVFTILLLIVIGPLCYAAMSYAVGSEYLGKPITVKESITKAFGKVVPVIWTGILSGFFIMIGFILFIIPGIYLLFKYYLAQQVVVLEDVSGPAALKRSGELMKGNMGIAFTLGAVLWVLGFVVSMIAAIIPIAIVQSIIQIVVQTGLFTMWCIVAVVLYFHCRAKNENYDLTLLAQEVGAEDYAPAGPPPIPRDN